MLPLTLQTTYALIVPPLVSLENLKQLRHLINFIGANLAGGILVTAGTRQDSDDYLWERSYN